MKRRFIAAITVAPLDLNSHGNNSRIQVNVVRECYLASIFEDP